MKKLLVISLLTVFAFGVSSTYVSARTVYDSTGRHIVKDDTLRAQKKARAERKIQAAAAAKINYEEDITQQKEETIQPLFKSNYYQDRNK